MTENNKKNFQGHRKRLKTRFLASNGFGMPDYEIIELLLFLTRPRSDTKNIAKSLVSQFKNMNDIIFADQNELIKINGIGENSVFVFKLFQEIIKRILKSKIESKPILGSTKDVVKYCKLTLGNLKIENFKIIFLNSKNMLIADEIHQTGTVNQTPVYTREVVKRALELSATSIIIVHNHPSGDITPSQNDILITKNINDACNKLQIKLLDHIIISRSDYISLKSLGIF